jgi:hypothetical protein
LIPDDVRATPSHGVGHRESAEADVGRPGQGETKSIRILGEILRAWSTRARPERQVAMSLAEMYAEGGILQRRISTRSVAVKNPGNGNRMCFNQSDRRPGADPPKNESGTVGARNGFCIAAKTFRERKSEESWSLI